MKNSLPGYACAIYDNKIINSTGNRLIINKLILNAPSNIQNIIIFSDYFCLLGKKFIMLTSRKNNNSYILKAFEWFSDAKIIDNCITVITLSGFEYIIDLNSLQQENSSLEKESITNNTSLIETYKIQRINKKSFLVVKYDQQKILGGTWDGYIFYNHTYYKIHNGPITDIQFNDKYIISCSYDRSVCLFDKEEKEIIYKNYTARNRLFGCGFCEYIDENYTKNNDKILFYTYDEEKILYLFENEKKIGQVVFESFSFTRLIFYNNFFVFITDTGQLIKIAHDQILQKNQSKIIKTSNLKDTYKLNFVLYKENDKEYIIQSNGNKIILYDENQQFNKILYIFDMPIRRVLTNCVIMHAKAYIMTKDYTSVLKEINSMHITFSDGYFLGVRNGTIYYEDYNVKICKDAITGILDIDNNLIMSSRDGYIYMIKDYKTVVNLNNNTVLPDKILKRKMCTNFIEGIFFNNNKIHIIHFKKNKLLIESHLTSSEVFISKKPKYFHIQNNQFYFLENEENKYVDLHGFDDKIFPKSNYTCGEYFKKNEIYILVNLEEIYVHNRNFNLLDRYKGCNISCFKYTEKGLLVGTLDGKILKFEIYNNMLWLKHTYQVDTRITALDVIYIFDSNFMAIFTGSGSIYFYNLEENNLVYNHNTNNVVYDAIYCDREQKLIFSNIFFGLDFLDLKFLKTYQKININEENNKPMAKIEIKNLHSGVIFKILKCQYNNINYIISGSDDHSIAIIEYENIHENLISKKKIIISTCPVIDIVHDNQYILVLSEYKTIKIIDLEDLSIFKTIYCKVYSPKKIVKTSIPNEFIIIGCGIEHIEIKF